MDYGMEKKSKKHTIKTENLKIYLKKVKNKCKINFKKFIKNMFKFCGF